MLAQVERVELRRIRGVAGPGSLAAVADVKCCGLRAKRLHARDLTARVGKIEQGSAAKPVRRWPIAAQL